MEAINTVDCKLANGKYHLLWIEFARYYEKNNRLKEAESVFSRAVESNYKNVEELASIWCEWIEMELRHQ
jgi:pre-mRNA-splicing factor SYF1